MSELVELRAQLEGELDVLKQELRREQMSHLSTLGQMQQLCEETVRYQVREFHRAFDLPLADTPHVPSDELVRLRLRILSEEFVELLEATFGPDNTDLWVVEKHIANLVDQGQLNVDLVEVADALADIDYLVEGTRLTFGIDGKPIAAEVHRSNMAKLGPEGKPIRRPDGKVVKPEGWQPPNIPHELELQGFHPRVV